MICNLCGQESNIIYATRKNNLICNICYWKLYNSKELKKEKELKKIEMYKRYGLC